MNRSWTIFLDMLVLEMPIIYSSGKIKKVAGYAHLVFLKKGLSLGISLEIIVF